VWDLPIIYIVENNQYGMGTSVTRASAVPDMSTKALAYGMEPVKVNGMNVIEVYEATKAAIEGIHNGKSPQFLEIVTYRYEGHSMGDPLRYRTKDEVEKWREDDPIGILERIIFDEKKADKSELEAIDQEVEKVIEAAVEFAEKSPFPALDSLFDNIYVEG
jgi:pyruvate dehydrogenase E1 component alpha subunit